MTHRTCTRCGLEKHVQFFRANDSTCKTCTFPKKKKQNANRTVDQALRDGVAVDPYVNRYLKAYIQSRRKRGVRRV